MASDRGGNRRVTTSTSSTSSSSLREAVSKIAREARTILDSFSDGNRLQDFQEHLSGSVPVRRDRVDASRQPHSTSSLSAGVSGTLTGQSQQNSPAVGSTPLANALRNAFPSINKKRKDDKSKSKSRSKKAKEDCIIHKDVIMLPKPDIGAVPTHQSRVQLETQGFVVHSVPINKSWDDHELSMQMLTLFPVIAEKNIGFDYVKSCYGQIIVPKLADGVVYDASRVIGLSGQGSIYIRARDDVTGTIVELSDSESSEKNTPPGSPIPKKTTIKQSRQATIPFKPCTDDGASTSKTIDELDQLKEMFPNSSDADLTDALKCFRSVQEAAFWLTGTDTTDEIVDLETLLNTVKAKMSECKTKLKIDEEDLVNDAMAYYKAPNFDPKKPLRIIYKGQPAADTGGVLRQFFSDLLHSLSEIYFVGSECKVPVYNADVVVSKTMKLIGTIIVHSIVQGGPGFPCFSPAVFLYLASGDVDMAMSKLTMADFPHQAHKEFIKNVMDTPDVSQLDEDDCIAVLSDCGLSVKLTNQNKAAVVQDILLHDAIAKPKIVLDQLRQGLETLGFLSMMNRFPELCEVLFVQKELGINSGSVIALLLFPNDENMKADQPQVKQFIMASLQSASQEFLKKFLVFATGAPCIPTFGLGTIKLFFDDIPSIFSSTCMMHLTFPKSFPSQEVFHGCLEAVCESSGKAFNCI